MSKIQEAFKNGKAFIPFITCGDPNLNITAELVKAAVDNGADLVELGIPFSDPVAEGPVIQEANVRALKGGVTTEKIFSLVEKLRKDVSVPLVFMTYANLIYSYGIEEFAKKSAQVGVDGLILPDVPYEEKEEFAPSFEKYGLDFISLVAPTSVNRLEMISREAKGFLYVVSSLGVTGVCSEIKTDLASIMQVVQNSVKVPAAIGFGISTPQQAEEISQYADGVIVGSAIMKIVAKYGEKSVGYVAEYIKGMKDAIR